MEGVSDSISDRSSAHWDLFSFSWASGLKKTGLQVVEYCAFPDPWG